MALLRAPRPVLGYEPPIGDLEEQSEQFVRRVEEASSGDDNIRSYVGTLEEQYGEQEQRPNQAQRAPDLLECNFDYPRVLDA